MLNIEKYLKIKRMENVIDWKILNFINYKILNNESWVKDKDWII